MVADGRDPLDVDTVDPGPGGAGPTPGNHALDRRLRTFELGFYRGVGPIADISVHAGGLGDVGTGVPEPHSLYPTGHDDADADRGCQTWHASQ
jgi:hypothetical protein